MMRLRLLYLDQSCRPSDEADLEALATAVAGCDLVACDAFVADVIRRTRLDLRRRCELFSGRRADVQALRDRLLVLAARSALAPFGERRDRPRVEHHRD